MQIFSSRTLTLIPLAALAAVVVGCGSSSSTKSTSVAATTVAAKPAAPRLHLHVISPRSGANVASTVTIRVGLTPAQQLGRNPLDYVLDGGRPRHGGVRLTLHNLKPGHHHLVVSVRGARATTTFTVRAPVHAASTTPAATTTTQTQTTATPHTSSAPAPSTTSSAPPPPRTTTAAPPPPRTTTPSAPPSGGIPQGKNAGDGDADNQGGPSDGDGNI